MGNGVKKKKQANIGFLHAMGNKSDFDWGIKSQAKPPTLNFSQDATAFSKDMAGL